MRHNQYILNDYKEFLNKSKGKKSSDLSGNSPASVFAEAVVYSFLKEHCNDVQVGKKIDRRSVEFDCTQQEEKYCVEVASVDAASLTNKSGLPNEEPKETGKAGFTRS